MIGKTIAHYQILEKLGEGGMGVVYKARDTHLDRFVAIKVLPAEKVADPERKRRFAQEAKAASALNHPNIITIYDIDQTNGVDFMAMEYVAGKTLDAVVPRKGLRLNETLKLAIQMADALAKAHSAGIIHRDVKPTNVMVTDDGLVKVLDFGLAKLTEVVRDEEGTRTTLLQTEEGAIVGTVSYMSPEQAEGKKVDARSDIFSFGSVLYEMATGQKAFQGESKMSTLMAVLKQEPKPVSQLLPAIAPDLEKIVNRCLRKDLSRRFQAMPDLKVALQELKEESDSGKLAATADPQSAPRRNTIWTVGFLTLFCVVALVTWFALSTGKGPPQAPSTAVPLTSYPGEERQPTFSPDGNQVAFSWNGEKQDNFDIYIKDVGSGAQRRLTTAPEADFYPAWSPDGRSIAFLRGPPAGKASVYLVSPLGPPERKVEEVSEIDRLAWTPDGKSLVVTDRNSDSEPSGLFLLSVESSEKRRLTSPGEKVFVDSQPAFSSDGRTLAFVREVSLGVSDLYLLSLSAEFQPTGEPKRLTFENRSTRNPVWSSDGHEIVFCSGQYLHDYSLFRIAVSGPGKPQRLASAGEDGCEPAISHRTQRLVYARELVDTNIWQVKVPGPYGKISSPMKLISSTRVDEHAQFSPNGKKIAFDSNRTGSNEIWVCNSDGSNVQQLTSFRTASGAPRWSPDGERIAFSSSQEGQREIYVISANGGKPKRLTNNPATDLGPSWSRDGKWIYFASNRSGEPQVWKMPADGGEAVQMSRKGGALALESPDSQWIYYAKGYFDNNLWKMRRNGGEETKVLESVLLLNFAIVKEGIFFIPRPDSAGRYFIQFYNFETKRIRSITAIERPIRHFLSVSPDGQWILYSQIDQMGSDLMLVENFR